MNPVTARSLSDMSESSLECTEYVGFLYSDNGTQLSSYEFEDFVQNWNFTYITWPHDTHSRMVMQRNSWIFWKWQSYLRKTQLKKTETPEQIYLCVCVIPNSSLTYLKIYRNGKINRKHDRNTIQELPPLCVGQQVSMQNPVPGL